MRDEVKLLLEIVENTKSSEKRADTITRLAFILERSNGREDDGLYVIWLSESLLKIKLSIEEQKDLVLRMFEILELPPMDSKPFTLLWVMGKAHPSAYFEKLLVYLLENYKSYPEKVIYQGLVSLNYCLEESLLTPAIIDSILYMTNELKESTDWQVVQHATWINNYLLRNLEKDD